MADWHCSSNDVALMHHYITPRSRAMLCQRRAPHLLVRLQGGGGGGGRRLQLVHGGPDVRQGQPVARATAGAGRPAGMPGIRLQAACRQATWHPLREAGRRAESDWN